MKTFLKGLAVALYAAVGVYLQGSGLPTDKSGWLIFGITIVGAILVYIGQRAAGLFTTSNVLAIQFKDFASAFIVAVGAALTNQAATYIVDGHFSMSTIWALITTTFVGLLAHKFGITNTSKSALLNNNDRVGGGVGTKPTD